MITVSLAGLAAWVAGAFVMGIAYQRWRQARALATRELERQQRQLDGEGTSEVNDAGKEIP